jgi:hypothetical protein
VHSIFNGYLAKIATGAAASLCPWDESDEYLDLEAP